MIDPELLKVLACPNDPDRTPLVQRGEWLVCEKSGKAYPIRDGIPYVRPEDAVELSEIEHE